MFTFSSCWYHLIHNVYLATLLPLFLCKDVAPWFTLSKKVTKFWVVVCRDSLWYMVMTPHTVFRCWIKSSEIPNEESNPTSPWLGITSVLPQSHHHANLLALIASSNLYEKVCIRIFITIAWSSWLNKVES